MMNEKGDLLGRLHYCLCTKLLFANSYASRLVTLHLVNQKSYYFISKKASFLATLPLIFN